MSQTAPPGWYNTPQGMRWFDGIAWAPLPQPPAPSEQPHADTWNTTPPQQQLEAQTRSPGWYPAPLAGEVWYWDGAGFSTPVPAESRVERAGWNTAAWFGAFLCWPLGILFSLIDISESNKRGIKPDYGPLVVSCICAVIGGFIFLAFLADAGTTTYR